MTTHELAILINAIAALVWLLGFLSSVASEALAHGHSVLEKVPMASTARSLIVSVGERLERLASGRGQAVWGFSLVLKLGCIPLAWRFASRAADEPGEVFSATSGLLAGIVAPVHSGMDVALLFLFGATLRRVSRWPLLVVPVAPVLTCVGAFLASTVGLVLVSQILVWAIYTFLGIDVSAARWGAGLAQGFMHQSTIALIIAGTIASLVIVAVPVVVLQIAHVAQRPTAQIMKLMFIEQKGKRSLVLAGLLYAIGNILAYSAIVR